MSFLHIFFKETCFTQCLSNGMIFVIIKKSLGAASKYYGPNNHTIFLITNIYVKFIKLTASRDLRVFERYRGPL